MRNTFRLLVLCVAVVLSACSKSKLDQPDRRTVLVYMAAANNLGSYAISNLEQMSQGYAQLGDTPGRNLLVYYDIGGGDPGLYRIDKTGARLLKRYPGANSTTQQQLSRVIDDVLTAYPAEDNGLILWSHATGWIPKDFPLATKSAFFSVAFPATRTFGNQYFNGQQYQMELEELSGAIPGGRFDFIITDACLMGGVETVYALREKAGYIVTYPTEVIAQGMPYREIVSDLVSDLPVETSLRNISVKFFDYYNSRSGMYRSAAVTLVRTEGLDELAAAVRAALKDNPAVSTLSLDGVQHYDLYARPFMYDLDDFVKQAADPSRYPAFRSALDKTVLYHANTPTFFSLPLERCCGLSAYIPCEAYAGSNEYYFRTQWCQAVFR